MTRALAVLAAAALLALAAPAASAAERAQQRLVERHAESVVFPELVSRCRGVAAHRDWSWDTALAGWRQRRAAVLDEGRALVERTARAGGSSLEAVDASILAQARRQQQDADPESLAWTCQKLRSTLLGDQELPMQGQTGLDEDSVREILDQMLPVARRLMPCEDLERIAVRPAPPPALRVDASSASALADQVQMWNVIGCGKSLDVELSLRLPPGEPPGFAMGFPRSAAPLSR